MKIISNNKGLSLVETLVMTAILGVSAFGLLKASQQTVLTSKTINLHKDTEDFKNSVYNILNLYCTDNLKPNVLTPDPSPDFNRVNPLRTNNNELFRVRTDDPTQRPIKKNFRNVIEVVDMKLTTEQNNETFYLYYKYNFPALGARQKRTDDNCDSGSVKGCYYLSCAMDYKCRDDDCNNSDDICKPLDCGVVETTIAEVACEDGQVLVGVTGIKSDDCKPGCPADQFLVGIKENAQGEKVAECAKVLECGEGEVAVESEPDSSGIHIMKCEKVACPAGQHIVLKNGNTSCIKTCHGGQRPTPPPFGDCACLHGEPDENGNCNCPEGKTEDSNTGNCVCPYGAVDDGNNGCECGIGRFRNHNNMCICTSGYEDDGNGNCICSEDSQEITLQNGNTICYCKSGGNRNSEGKCLCKSLQCPSKQNCVCDYRGKVETGLFKGRCKNNPQRQPPRSWLENIINNNIPCPEE